MCFWSGVLQGSVFLPFRAVPGPARTKKINLKACRVARRQSFPEIGKVMPRPSCWPHFKCFFGSLDIFFSSRITPRRGPGQPKWGPGQAGHQKLSTFSGRWGSGLSEIWKPSQPSRKSSRVGGPSLSNRQVIWLDLLYVYTDEGQLELDRRIGRGLTWAYLNSLEIIWTLSNSLITIRNHLKSLESIWNQFNGHGCTWNHMISYEIMGIYMKQLEMM